MNEWKTWKFAALGLLCLIFALAHSARANAGEQGFVEGRVFFDVNMNGEDDGEPRLKGFKIYLNGAGNPNFLAQTFVDENGRFYFRGLPKDSYVLCAQAPNAIAPWIPTTARCKQADLQKNTEASIKFGSYREESLRNVDLSKRSAPLSGCVRSLEFWVYSAEGRKLSKSLLKESGALGERVYTAKELLIILRLPDQGNALMMMARQLIAAKLNQLSGADVSAAQASLAKANKLFSMNGNTAVAPHIYPANTGVSAEMVNMAGEIEKFNLGVAGVAPCEH